MSIRRSSHGHLNFIAVPEKTVRRMLVSGVHFLVSINAATRETFRTISGRDAFESVTEGLRLLVRLRRELRVPIEILVSFILMRRNINELNDFIRLAADLGVDGVRLPYLRCIPRRTASGADVPTPSPQRIPFITTRTCQIEWFLLRNRRL
jgi:MoaA/NifB/PqqE/SkfB family radical SAM enzyme